MSDPLAEAYDALPYPSPPRPATQPDRLATVASLFGMEPAPAESCRVLELGCDAGGNLLSMAYALRGSDLLGVDLSGRHVEAARRRAEELDLGNVRFLEADFQELGEEHGEFDYVIAHGLYSWVPAPLQGRLLEIARRHLAPGGVAYLSYNVYPGWHSARAMREMLRYRATAFPQPEESVRQARALAAFLADAVPRTTGAYRQMIAEEWELLRRKPDAYLYHGYLAEENHPVLFRDFVADARERGLRYIADAHFYSGFAASRLPPEMQKALRALARGRIEQEQYADFLFNRRFRSSLLCRREAELDLRITPERLAGMAVASQARADGEVGLAPETPVRFERAGGELETRHPLSKAAFLELAGAWPAALPLDELGRRARKRLPAGGADERDELILAEHLLMGYTRNLLDLHRHPPRFETRVGPKPRATAPARLQAERGEEVTNLRHEEVPVDAVTRLLLPRVDGGHTFDDLLAFLEARAADGALEFREEGTPEERRGQLESLLRAILDALARSALLEA